MIVRKDERDDYLAVGEGLVEISRDRINIVTDMAVSCDSIEGGTGSPTGRGSTPRKISLQEVASVHASLARSLAQLYVRRRHRRI